MSVFKNELGQILRDVWKYHSAPNMTPPEKYFFLSAYIYYRHRIFKLQLAKYCLLLKCYSMKLCHIPQVALTYYHFVVKYNFVEYRTTELAVCEDGFLIFLDFLGAVAKICSDKFYRLAGLYFLKRC